MKDKMEGRQQDLGDWLPGRAGYPQATGSSSSQNSGGRLLPTPVAALRTDGTGRIILTLFLEKFDQMQ